MTNVVSFRRRNTEISVLRWSPKPASSYRMVNKVMDGDCLLKMVGDFPRDMDAYTWNLIYVLSPEITQNLEVLVLGFTRQIQKLTLMEVEGATLRKKMEGLHPVECVKAVADSPDIYRFSDLRGKALVDRALERLAHLSQGTP